MYFFHFRGVLLCSFSFSIFFKLIVWACKYPLNMCIVFQKPLSICINFSRRGSGESPRDLESMSIFSNLHDLMIVAALVNYKHGGLQVYRLPNQNIDAVVFSACWCSMLMMFLIVVGGCLVFLFFVVLFVWVCCCCCQYNAFWSCPCIQPSNSCNNNDNKEHNNNNNSS